MAPRASKRVGDFKSDLRRKSAVFVVASAPDQTVARAGPLQVVPPLTCRPMSGMIAHRRRFLPEYLILHDHGRSKKVLSDELL
jgi:hypothetical protein